MEFGLIINTSFITAFAFVGIMWFFIAKNLMSTEKEEA